MASSPIITVSGFNLPGAIGTAQAAYMPSVAALRGANALEQVTTVGLTTQTLTLIVISNVMSFWVLAVGAANVSDPNNQVAPLDYNASTNNVYWQRTGGFDVLASNASRLTNSTTQTIASGVATALSFDTIRFDSGQYSAANPTRLTAQAAGNYEIAASVSFAPNASGTRYVALRLNGSTILAQQQPIGTPSSSGTANAVNLSVSTTWALQVGDYVEAVVYQNSGNSLNVLKSNAFSPEFSCVLMGNLASLVQASTVVATGAATSNPVIPSGSIDLPFNITQAGWYSIWQGLYPASGNFDVKRVNNSDGQTSDTVVDFTIIAGSPEGIINIQRNAVANSASPSIDAVRVSHVVATGLATVDVHLTRGGNWNLTYPSNDPNYLPGPLLSPDVITADGQMLYKLIPNVTGGSGAIDVPAVNSGGNSLVQPQGGVFWAPWTGTPSRVSQATSTATLTQVAQALKAVIDDLVFAGIFQVGIPATLLYNQVFALAQSLVSENSVANATDIFRISAAPDTTVQGIYVPVGTFNGHNFYKIQGWEYEAAGQNSPRQVYWSTAWSTWTISNASGNLYHSGATEATPWQVVQWKDQSSTNQTVTTVAPNIPLTYNALTDTHSAMILSGSSAGYNGLYLRGADFNGKRHYYLVGTSSNNKRLEWDNVSTWLIKDDSSTRYNAIDSSTYPDQVAAWTDLVGSDVVAIAGVNAVDLMSGITVGDPTSTYNGIYSPIQGAYNASGGRNLIYRRTDGAYYIQSTGNVSPAWILSATVGGLSLKSSDNQGNFPWNDSWATANLTMQENKIASPGWNNLATQPNTNITNNVIGNWHL